MQIRLLGDLGAQRVDDDQPAARALGPANAAHEVQIGGGRVVAPDDVELGVLGEFGRASGDGAIGPDPRLAAHPAAQCPPVELGSAEPMEEAQRHAVAGEKAVRAGIVQRHHRLRPPPIDDGADPLVDLVERRLPRDPLELPGTLGSDAAQRVKETLLAMHEVAGVTGDLVADHTGRIRDRIGAADLDDAALIDIDRQAAGVGAVEGAHTRLLFQCHGNLLLIAPFPFDHVAQRLAVEIGAQIGAEEIDGAVAVLVTGPRDVRGDQHLGI